MSEPKIPFGLSNGRMIAIDAMVERGLACECVCCECGGALVACKGEVRRHYFRHHAELTNCTYPRETAIHKFAKQTICDSLACRLPEPDLGVMISARTEVRVGTIRPDVLAHFTVEPVAIEIFVAHQVPREKIAVFDTQRLAAIEIDLRPYRHANLTEEQWRATVIDGADRVWLYPPKQVREENDRMRRAAIAAQRQRERELRALIAEAERMRNEAAAAAERALNKAAQEQQERLLARAEAERKAAQRELKDAERRAAFRQWRERMVASPELPKLIAAHGGYDKITEEAWEQFDADVDWFQHITRLGLRYLPDDEFVLTVRSLGAQFLSDGGPGQGSPPVESKWKADAA